MNNNNVAASLISRSWEPQSTLSLEESRNLGGNMGTGIGNRSLTFDMNRSPSLGSNFKKKPMGRLELIIGPMFASKTTELIRNYNRYKVLDKNILSVNHTIDSERYGSNNITSHNHEIINDCYSCEKLCDIMDLESYQDIEVIIIDELQFFNDAFEFCTKATDEDGKIVIAAGLDGDYRRRPFGDVLNLVPYAESVIKVTALCKRCNDGTPAVFTKRTVNSDSFILVGSSESYEAVCRHHFNN